jgi:HK97 family phage portal protein
MVVSHPGKLSPQAHDNLKDSLTSAQSGLGKSHRLLLLEEGMKVEKYGIPPDDCQFLESRGFQIPEVARWFNLPHHKLKDLSRSSFSNIEQEQTSFYVDSLLPWLVRLEQNYNMQLLTEGDRALSGRGRLYFKHSAEGILRADSASRGAFYRELFGIGGITINQILEKEDMNQIDHPFANEPFVPLNMVPLSLIEKMLEKNSVKQGAEEKVPEKSIEPSKKQVSTKTPKKKEEEEEED